MNRTSATLFFAAALSCSGCLDFDRQTIHAIFPEGRDELHAVFIHGGLHVSGKEKKDTTLAQQQLKELVEGKSFYLGSNIVGFSFTDQADDRSKQLHALLTKHLKISGGVLFLDEQSNLNACQTVRISKLTEFVAGLNEVIAAEFARCSEQKRASLPPDDFYDLETLALIDRAIRDKHVWLKCEPGRLSFTMPASAAVIGKVKRELSGANDLARLTNQAQALSPDSFAAFKKSLAEAGRGRRNLIELPWSFQQGRQCFTVSLGVGEGEPLHLPIAGPGSRLPTWEGELVNFARDSQLPIRKDVTEASLIEKLQREVKQLGK